MAQMIEGPIGDCNTCNLPVEFELSEIVFHPATNFGGICPQCNGLVQITLSPEDQKEVETRLALENGPGPTLEPGQIEVRYICDGKMISRWAGNYVGKTVQQAIKMIELDVRVITLPLYLTGREVPPDSKEIIREGDWLTVITPQSF